MSTYTYQDCIDFCRSMVKGIPVTQALFAVDQVNSIFWKAYPWPWTRDTLTAIPLVDRIQDYSLDPTDQNLVWRLTNARITYVYSSGGNDFRDIRIMRHLEPLLRTTIGWPNFQLISYEVELDKVRLEAATSVPAGTTLQIDGEYQIFPVKVTSLAQTIQFPDYHMNTYNEGLLWYLYRLSNDKREGGVVMRPDGTAQFTGQMGAFYMALMMAKEAEEHGAGDTIYPGDSIGGSSLYIPGFFGGN